MSAGAAMSERVVGVAGLLGVVIGAAFRHPLTPLVVGDEGEGEGDEYDNGEDEFHKDGLGTRGQGLATRDKGLETRDWEPGTRASASTGG